jgi:enterochelin esterase-like enzyme
MNSVTIHTLHDFPSKHLDNARNIQVLLPPNYSARNPKRTRYPVLYLNDGQDLAVLRVKTTLQALYDAKQLPHLIVVGIPTNADRLNEYGTAHTADYKGRGAKAAAYTRFVIDEVLPEINALYRTRTEPAHTALLGASLGGLSAFDIVWNNPSVFGVCGVCSGSFWWRTAGTDLKAKTISRIAHKMVRAAAANHKRKTGLRFWFQAGTADEQEDRDKNGVIDAIQDTTELMDELAKKGYKRNQDMVYVEVPGGQHNPATWATVLDMFLQFAFGRQRCKTR